MKRLLYVYPSPDATDRLSGAIPDVVVVDLEEAVAEPGKAKARARLETTARALVAAGAPVIVRVNGAGTFHMALDLDEVRKLPSEIGVLLPKPLDASLVRGIIADHAPRPVWLMAESCDTTAWLPDVLAETQIAGLVIGGKDLCLDFGIQGYQPGHPAVREFVKAVVNLSCQSRIDVFDAVAFGEEGVREAAIRARSAGCSGFSLINAKDLHAVSDL